MPYGRHRPRSSPLNSLSVYSFDNPHISNNRVSRTPVALRQLGVQDLDEDQQSDFDQLSSRQRIPFQIPRPFLTLPHSPNLDQRENNSFRIPDERLSNIEQYSSLPNHISTIHPPQQPIYQAVPVINPSRMPIQPQFLPVSPKPRSIWQNVQRLKPKKYVRERSPGFCTTLCSGGLATFVAVIYLITSFALPITKLTLGIVYINQCPANTQIPIYMIVSGACGLGIVLFLLISSTCSYCRSSIEARKFVHQIMILIIAIGRGMQGVLAIFLFVWFFVGNAWVFGIRYRVRTDDSNDTNNYCHPTLYWFAFYVLIFTYVFAVLACVFKFCTSFFCCQSLDMFKRVFS